MSHDETPDFDTPRPVDDASAFKAYFDTETNTGNSLTIHEDGTLTFSGTVSANEALQMLHRAMSDIQTYMRHRPMPPQILQGDLPQDEQNDSRFDISF